MRHKTHSHSCTLVTESTMKLNLLAGIASIIDLTGSTFIGHIRVGNPDTDSVLLNDDMRRIGDDFKKGIDVSKDLKELSF